MGHDDLLKGSEFFAETSEDVLALIVSRGETKNLQRGDVLFNEGDKPESMYVVLSGRIAIAIGNRPLDSRESMLALMERGDLFGELGLLDGGARSAMARAIEPSSVLEIAYKSVREQLESNPSMLWGVTKLLAKRLRTMDEVLSDSVFLDVTGRTAKRLLELSNGKDEFVLPITQEELAGMVGASRERVNKAIASFIRLGWIEQHDRRYHILMRAKLEFRASSTFSSKAKLRFGGKRRLHLERGAKGEKRHEQTHARHLDRSESQHLVSPIRQHRQAVCNDLCPR